MDESILVSIFGLKGIGFKGLRFGDLGLAGLFGGLGYRVQGCRVGHTFHGNYPLACSLHLKSLNPAL